MSEHGTNTRYQAGCRCVDCTYAHNLYNKARYAELRRLAKIGAEVERLVRRQ